MPPTLRFTGPAALLIGAAVGLAGIQAPTQDQASRPAKVTASPNAQSSPHHPTTETRPTASAGSCIAAWNSLKDGQLPKKERIALQCAILQEWAMVDLSAAIRAVVADQESRFASFQFDDPMRNALHAGIAANPDLAWHFIETHAFGLHTKWIREAWITAVSFKDPMKVLQESRDSFGTAMKVATERTFAADQSSTACDEFVAFVLALPNQPDTLSPRKSLVDQLRSTVGYPGLLDHVRRAQNHEVRRVYLEAYLLITTGIQLDPEVEPEWKSDLNSLPPEIREEAEQFLRDHPDLRWGG